MIKKFKNSDSIFKSSYEDFEEEPSAGLWPKINAGLDKQDVERYKKGFIAWKRISLLLILLMTIYVLYDSLLRTPEIKSEVSVKQHSTKAAVNSEFAVPVHIAELRAKSYPVYFASIMNEGFTAKAHGVQAEAIQVGDNASVIIPKPDSLSLVTYLQTLNADKRKFYNGPADKNNMIKPNLPKPYWSISALASYDQVMYRLDDDLPGDSKEDIENRENHKASFSLGILAEWHFKKSWSFQTGLVYSHVSIGINPQKIYASAESSGVISYKYITSSGYAFIKPGLVNSSVGDSLSTATADHHLVFISLPLSVVHQFDMRRFSFLPSAGFAVNFLAKASISTVVTEQSRVEAVTITRLNGTRLSYLSFDAAMGLQYHLTPRMRFVIEPSFKFAATSITHNNVVNNFPYSWGIGIGAQMNF